MPSAFDDSISLYVAFDRRCRTASNSTMPAATDTFRLSTCPRIGIDTSQSHRSRTSRRSPVPSAPSTSAVGSVKSISS